MFLIKKNKVLARSWLDYIMQWYVDHTMFLWFCVVISLILVLDSEVWPGKPDNGD